MEPTQNTPQTNPDEQLVRSEAATPYEQQEAVASAPVTPENAPNFAAPPPLQSPAPTADAQQKTTIATIPDSPVSDSAATPSLNTPMPAIADDSDLIEREWVDKAKAIVEHTKDDPHMQNKEINKMKADYIQKRYNRQIKINEG